MRELKEDFQQEFRDSDYHGKIGAQGYLNYFQNQASLYMHRMHRGNDTLISEFGIAWMYTKYRLQDCRPMDFSSPLHAEVWISKAGRATMETDIEFSSDGQILCRGRLESCLYHKEKHMLQPLSAIALPDDLVCDRRADVDKFSRPARSADDMEYVYTYKVRYSDLDNNHHMTNLRYGAMFIDAFDSGFYKCRNIRNFEIHYLNQTFEGEEIKIYRSVTEGRADLLALRSDGSRAAWCRMDTEKLPGEDGC